MTRSLYRCLLWLHPRAFREQFAGEMLWIFDEAAESQGVSGLLFDAMLSLARQRLMRSGSWKVAAAALGALLQMAIVATVVRPALAPGGSGQRAIQSVSQDRPLPAADREVLRQNASVFQDLAKVIGVLMLILLPLRGLGKRVPGSGRRGGSYLFTAETQSPQR